MTAAEMRAAIQQKRGEFENIMAGGRTEQVDENGMPIWDGNKINSDVIRELNQREAELASMEQDYQRLRLKEMDEKNRNELESLNRIERKYTPQASIYSPTGVVPRPADMKSLSDHFMASGDYQVRRNNRNWKGLVAELDGVDMKTLMSLSAGYAPANPRTDRVVVSAQRRPVVSDVIPTDNTDLQVIKWMEETTFTNNASTVSEGATKGEAALAFTERTATVRKIAVWLPVTEEQLDDVNGLRNIIDNRLTLMLLQHEEHQLLFGGNSDPNFNGFMQASGVQTQTFDTNNSDTIYKAFTKVRYTGFAEPSAVIIHPDNWQTIRLQKTTTNEYIFGDPQTNVAETIWGKPVIVTPAMTSGKALTGDFVLFSHLSRKMGLRIDISDSHGTFFIENKLAIRAEMRECLELYRGAAFCKCESLT